MSNYRVTKREEYETLEKDAKVGAIVNAFNAGTCALGVLGLEILKKKVGVDASEGFKQTVFYLIEPLAAIGSIGSVIGLVKELSKKSYYERMIDTIDIEEDLARGGRI